MRRLFLFSSASYSFYSFGSCGCESGRWPKVGFFAIFPIGIRHLRSGHSRHGPQRKSIGMALVEDVPIINPPVDQTSIRRARTDKRGLKRDIGLHNITGEHAFLRVLRLLRHRTIRLDHLNEDRSDKRRGFAVIVDADLKVIEVGAGPPRASRHVSSFDVRNMFGGNASDPPQPASGPPKADG